MKVASKIRKQVAALRDEPQEARVQLYNELMMALAEELLHDLPPDPATRTQLLPTEKIEANAYNPNRTASTELDLLENSMRSDGITMNVVVIPEGGRWVIVDGFHRRLVAADRLGRRYTPCSVIERPMADRMASTVRHNRARGKHQVDLMAALVREMMALNWDDQRIAENLGMTLEEILRLRQIVGAAKALAAEEYSREWQVQEST